MSAVATVVATCCFAIPQDNSARTRESLARHCFNEAFVSLSARTRNRDTIPNVSLLLTDPLGRMQGEGVRGAGIPTSSYGQIVQVLSSPQRSRALAIEVCGAVEGEYEVMVKEQGTENYVVDLAARYRETSTLSLLLYHHAQYGRTRKYRFTFRVEKKEAVVRWLDSDGREVMELEPNEW
jgi:hypothetical protein